MTGDHDAVAAQLAALMRRHAVGMIETKGGETSLEMVAPHPNPLHPKQPMWFGGVRSGKAYASYHLMPLYTHPALLERLSPELKKRMQGKSCLNFKAADEGLFEELAAITQEGARLYAEPLTYSEGAVSTARGRDK
ncbi:hypothetical protein QO010_002808 [Caulobacter ginsengisoli]|uniref:YdhG-like domain-containing protein n=1 Tax=Caulobacter ginsengisoli TaxID=400775 RepID=A0ABU0ISN3_9CAUL|nr:hypothetical protein [Caulobacter ginsengisoli]MDQ0465024.1 hypothetical protein [Caulobacter ginsengisoli]